jgi:cytochrome c5
MEKWNATEVQMEGIEMGWFGRNGRYAVSLLVFVGGVRVLAAGAAVSPHASTAAAKSQPSGLRADLFSELPASRSLQAPAGEIPLPEGKGRDLTKRLCSACHSSNVWAAQRHTREKWGSIIDNMLSKGLEASDDDLAVIQDYLTASFGPASTDSPASATPGTPAPAPQP